MVDRGRLVDFNKKLSYVDARIRVAAPNETTEPLPIDFEPGHWNVICQGGKDSYDHIGNRRFRVCIENNLNTYAKAKSKHERSMVVTSIVDAIRECQSSNRGGFIRKEITTGRWYEVGDKTAREKVGHALRDAIKLRNREEQQTHSIRETDKVSKHRFKRRRTKEPYKFEEESSNNPVVLCPQHSDSSATAATAASELKSSGECDVADSRVKLSPVVSVVVEAEWEKSLKESSKQFQDSDFETDDESDSGDSSILKQVAVQPLVDHTIMTPFFANEFMEPSREIGQSTDGTIDPARESATGKSLEWNPPGCIDVEHHFEDYIRNMGLSMASASNVVDASTVNTLSSATSPFLAADHQTCHSNSNAVLIEDYSSNGGDVLMV